MSDNADTKWRPASGPAGSVEIFEDGGWMDRPPSSRVALAVSGPRIRDEAGLLPGVAELREMVRGEWTAHPSRKLLSAALDCAEQARREVSAADRELQRLQLDLAEILDATAAPGQAKRVAEAQGAIAAAERHLAALRTGYDALAAKAGEARVAAERDFALVVRLSSLRVREAAMAELEGVWRQLLDAAGEKIGEVVRLALVERYTSLSGDMHLQEVRELLGRPAPKAESPAVAAAGPAQFGTPHLRHERAQEPTQPHPVAPSGRPPIALMTHHTGRPGMPTMRAEGQSPGSGGSPPEALPRDRQADGEDGPPSPIGADEVSPTNTETTLAPNGTLFAEETTAVPDVPAVADGGGKRKGRR